MRQILVHGRYHADLHPANLLITPEGRIAYFDFGIVGRLGRTERRAVTHLLAALVSTDAQRVLEWAEHLGLAVPSRCRTELAGKLHAVMAETLSGRSDLREFGIGLLGVLARHRVPIPIGLGLLVESLVTVEGVACALYPDVDLVSVARPFVAELLLRDSLSLESLRRNSAAAVAGALHALAAPRPAGRGAPPTSAGGSTQSGIASGGVVEVS